MIKLAHERVSAMLMKLPDVMRETALGRSSIYAAIKAGRHGFSPTRLVVHWQFIRAFEF
ncbi:MAG TPA: AlpA family phage regulatory protein [Vitreimonas sp.]|nr:AlpA family phage regulatory protein [Vitreimonas sp.]